MIDYLYSRVKKRANVQTMFMFLLGSVLFMVVINTVHIPIG